MKGYSKIGQIMLDMGLINQEQFDQALSIQKKTSEQLGEILLKLQIVDQKSLAKALAKQHHLEYVDISALDILPEVTKRIPLEQCRQYTLIPISEDDSTLHVALADPLNLIALDNLRMYLGKDIQGVIAAEESIKNAIAEYYEGKKDSKQKASESETVTDEDVSSIANLLTAEEEKITKSEGPVIQLVSHLILEAFKRRASDIHVEPFTDRLRIRYRIDGILHEVKTVPKTLQGSVTSRLKIMSKLDIAEKRLPQDGRIKLRISNKDVDFRLSTLPSIYGESVVLRILDRSQLLLKLTDLGFSEREEKMYQELINLPNGVLLVTGPTGSGKTTTLYTSLNAINKPDRKIITVEDPIEYQLNGINQVQVRPNLGLTFSSALRSILRQAPNIIMIGEIRDTETANIAIESSLTGHLVFSTLHTNDAPGAVVRLIDMGVKSYLVASAVQAVLAQRLVRQICPDCKEKIDPNFKTLQLLGLDTETIQKATFYKGAGCDQCSKTGYKGRIAIFEFFKFNDEIRNLIYKNASRDVLRERAKQYGMRTLREDGIEKVLKGITTLEEVFRVTQSDID